MEFCQASAPKYSKTAVALVQIHRNSVFPGGGLVKYKLIYTKWLNKQQQQIAAGRLPLNPYPPFIYKVPGKSFDRQPGEQPLKYIQRLLEEDASRAQLKHQLKFW